MTAILTLIYCWLQEFFFSLTDWGLNIWDSLLSVADSTLATIGTAGLTLPVIPDQYAWVLGARVPHHQRRSRERLPAGDRADRVPADPGGARRALGRRVRGRE